MLQLTKKLQYLTMENLPNNYIRRATPLMVEMIATMHIKLEAHHSLVEFCKGINSSKLFATRHDLIIEHIYLMLSEN